MTRKMTKALRVPTGKFQTKARQLTKIGGTMDEAGWSESSDGSWSDFTGEWMDFTRPATKLNQVTNPVRNLKRNIKVR